METMIENIMQEGISPNRPEPILSNIQVVLYHNNLRPEFAVEALLEGHYVLIADFFSSGLEVLTKLKQYINDKYPDQSYQGQRDARSAYRELSHKLLLKIKDHRLVVKKAPVIGWLNALYPELTEFLLPFPTVQGLNSSWQWFEKGIFIPVLKKKIHPWFEVYFPTRFEHLELFDHWLKNYRGEKNTAYDIGVGSGILSLMLMKYGFHKVYATDINPNAIIGVSLHREKNSLHEKLVTAHGDLFAGFDAETDLIVFNPAWLPASFNTEGLDSAIYYDDSLFPRFFKEAAGYMKAGGKLVILFSNLARVTDMNVDHPVESELVAGGRFKKELFVEKQVRPSSGKTKRDLSRRSSEKVELWVLRLL